LGYLSRSDYNTYLGEIEVKKRKNDINFVMSFAIFDKMNKNVFENRYFNFFTRETFFQGESIILQDQKINKVFFIKEGQYEITTNLTIDKIYSILQNKTKKTIDDNKKIKIKNQNFNMRLYICYNKDILGLEDCCFNDGISFITAKCLTSKGSAFTIEKSILNEIKIKIPEIETKINIIKEKREQVMVDRLISIYTRIKQTKNKDRNNEINTNTKINKNTKKNINKKDNNDDSFKYINYLFGLNKNKKIMNLKHYQEELIKAVLEVHFLYKKGK
jgi:prolyl oligopeptidase PreP (S9A serine peptidase family)